MFSAFRQNNDTAAADVKIIRDRLLRFIKEQLQQWEGGEGGQVRLVKLYVAPAEADLSLYEAALFAAEEGRFQREGIQKIADDYALELPEDWKFEAVFTDALPEGSTKGTDLPVAILISTSSRGPVQQTTASACIKVLNGEAEATQYRIASGDGKINMGREKTVQTADGFYRINNIAFPAESTHPGNRFVSRQHAHIEWDAATGAFLLFADEGGVPPRNKVKVRPQGGEAVKLQSTRVGYALKNGDQIMLGDSALLQFEYE